MDKTARERYAEQQKKRQAGHTKGEEAALDDMASVFADKFRQYINGTRAAERTRKSNHKI